jgi:hypothetical protein
MFGGYGVAVADQLAAFTDDSPSAHLCGRRRLRGDICGDEDDGSGKACRSENETSTVHFAKLLINGFERSPPIAIPALMDSKQPVCPLASHNPRSCEPVPMEPALVLPIGFRIQAN